MVTQRNCWVWSLGGMLALVLSIQVMNGRVEGRPLTHDEMEQRVGALQSKCCMPGRRVGCDPINFNQTGCVALGIRLSCQPKGWSTMPCTACACLQGTPEDVCEVNIKSAGRNQCKPTGKATTVGCPADQWQCGVEMLRWDSENAPKVDVLVCDRSVSTICPYAYQVCE